MGAARRQSAVVNGESIAALTALSTCGDTCRLYSQLNISKWACTTPPRLSSADARRGRGVPGKAVPARELTPSEPRAAATHPQRRGERSVRGKVRHCVGDDLRLLIRRRELAQPRQRSVQHAHPLGHVVRLLVLRGLAFQQLDVQLAQERCVAAASTPGPSERRRGAFGCRPSPGSGEEPHERPFWMCESCTGALRQAPSLVYELLWRARRWASQRAG
jgi:hypothetical protein